MALSFINLENLENAKVKKSPYTHMVGVDIVSEADKQKLSIDYPEIENPGFFPLDTMKLNGNFERLIQELQGPEIAEILTRKLNIELRDKPRMITIRRWSAKKDGRIHNDGEAKIVTALLYLNDSWPQNEDGGKFRVLTSDKNFEDCATEVPPDYGTFVAFVRSHNSWHGHKPFAGERRVVQVTWLRSEEDLERKKKRGKLSFLLKKVFGG